MEMKNFEDSLSNMTKPEVPHLKHQDMLAKLITHAKDKSVLSWWWLSIPLYLMAALVMKTVFMPHTSFIANLHDLAGKEKYSSVLFFLVIPIVFIIINFISIRKVFFLSGGPRSIHFLRLVWFNVLMIVLALLILIIYSL
jgi:hypothetical protein